ncbi:hypothetical protein B0J11DRAFT_464828 [Dendryphion nanum]|uniref:Uncharacterized protein n=1 Tax=Dendryphion nanum TaxID=256645 RepID=A0A9P9DP54_9PLEO|nr:hypothetical protein B0J11DRAFT_464828 [Dendryphion nanum]
MSSSSSTNQNAPLDSSNKLGAGTTPGLNTGTTNQTQPSVISSGGAIGSKFNPDGAIGQIGEKVGGPFSKDGVIGGQFDASKNGIAGQVEKAVGGPSQNK